MSFKEIVDAGVAALTFLTPARIVKLCCLLVIAAVCIGFWDNRPTVYSEINSTIGKISTVEIPPPSEKTKQNIRNVVNHDSTIVAAQLVNFSLISNTKKPIFFYSDSMELQDAMDHYQLTKIAESELLQRRQRQQRANCPNRKQRLRMRPSP